MAENRKTRIVILAANQLNAVKSTIESIRGFSGLDDSQIIVVDNGSEDGLGQWLSTQQDFDYMICDEGMEGYARLLNEAITHFIDEEDLLILSPGLMILPGCVEALYKALEEEEQIGAVCARRIRNDAEEGKSFSIAAEYALSHAAPTKKRELLGLPYEAVLIRNGMLRESGGFDSQLILPGSTMVDFSFWGIKKNYRYYEIQNAFVYKISDSEKIYSERFGKNIDRQVLKQKWGMNYFNDCANCNLLSYVEKEKEAEFSVLEIGCDCGVNLLHLKNQYPNAQLYGVEINASAAEIAAHVARIQVANIEDQSLDFAGTRFDYIIFGDVLEHLRDPEGTVQYCKSLLKEDGRILACIPNLMHYTVMYQLLNGNFTYTDTGLLDRTHIHFFTFNEIMRMFQNAGYEVDKINSVGNSQAVTEEVREFIDRLMSLSDDAKEFMFYTLQYIISAGKRA